MQTKYKTKEISNDGAREEIRQKEKYHFAGGGEYEPISVEAGNQEEAEKIWQVQRKKVEKIKILKDNK